MVIVLGCKGYKGTFLKKKKGFFKCNGVRGVKYVDWTPQELVVAKKGRCYEKINAFWW